MSFDEALSFSGTLRDVYVRSGYDVQSMSPVGLSTIGQRPYAR